MSETDTSSMPPPAVPTTEPPTDNLKDKIETMDAQESSQPNNAASSEKPGNKKDEVGFYMVFIINIRLFSHWMKIHNVWHCKLFQRVNTWTKLLFQYFCKHLDNLQKNVHQIRFNFWLNICFVKKIVSPMRLLHSHNNLTMKTTSINFCRCVHVFYPLFD